VGWRAAMKAAPAMTQITARPAAPALIVHGNQIDFFQLASFDRAPRDDFFATMTRAVSFFSEIRCSLGFADNRYLMERDEVFARTDILLGEGLLSPPGLETANEVPGGRIAMDAGKCR
jgi:hypothetical protein